MLSLVYRVLLAVVGMAPMSFAILCAGKRSTDLAMGVVLSVASCIAGMLILLFVMRPVVRRLPLAEIKAPVSISPRRDNLFAYGLAYVIPLLFGDSVDAQVITSAVLALLVAACVSSQLTNIPLLLLIGYRFYDVGLPSGVMVLVVSRRPPQALKHGIQAIRVSEDSYIEWEGIPCLNFLRS